MQVLISVGIGMALLPLVGRTLGNVLNDISLHDPGIYGVVVATTVVIAVAATLTPTRSALKVNPAAALRYE